MTRPDFDNLIILVMKQADLIREELYKSHRVVIDSMDQASEQYRLCLSCKVGIYAAFKDDGWFY